MNWRSLFLTFSLAVWAGCLSPSLAADQQGCAVTKPSGRFMPPPPYESNVGSLEFFYGTAALWTVIYLDWHIHSGGKLPFFRQGYDLVKERSPIDCCRPAARWQRRTGLERLGEQRVQHGWRFYDDRDRRSGIRLLGDRCPLRCKSWQYSDPELHRVG